MSATPRFWLVGGQLIGDALMLTPAIRAFRLQWPEAEIYYRHPMEPKSYLMLRGNPHLTRLEVANHSPHDPGAQVIEMSAMKALLAGMASGRTLTEGFGDQLGVRVTDLRYDYVMSSEEADRGAALAAQAGCGRPVVVVARHSVSCTSNDPAVGRSSKCIPNQIWCGVARWLWDRGFMPVAVGSDKDMNDARYSEWPGAAVYGARVRDIAGMLRAAAGVLSVDTGIRHLAAAAGAHSYCVSCAYPLSVIRCVAVRREQRVLEEHIPLEQVTVERLLHGISQLLEV